MNCQLIEFRYFKYFEDDVTRTRDLSIKKANRINTLQRFSEQGVSLTGLLHSILSGGTIGPTEPISSMPGDSINLDPCYLIFSEQEV